jgi:hypothetical protein
MASSGLANCAAAGNAIMIDATPVTSIKSFFIMNPKIVVCPQFLMFLNGLQAPFFLLKVFE